MPKDSSTEHRPTPTEKIKVQESIADRKGKEEYFLPLDFDKFPTVTYHNYDPSECGDYPILKNLDFVMEKVYLLRPSSDPSKIFVKLYIDYGFLEPNKLWHFYIKIPGTHIGKVRADCVIKLFNGNFCLVAEIPMLHSSFFSEHPISKAEQLFVGLIENIEEEAIYYYQIECFTKSGRLFAATPLKRINNPVRPKTKPYFFASISDLHAGNGATFKRGKVWWFKAKNNPRLNKVFNSMVKNQNHITFNEGFTLITTSGDNVDNGSYHEYWADLFDCGKELLSTTTFVPGVGNHDYYRGSIFPFRRGAILGGFNRTLENYHTFVSTPRENGKEGSYFSFDVGNMHYIFLDSLQLRWGNERIDCESKQWKWLENDLKQWRERIHKEDGEGFCFVFLHSAIFSLGLYGRLKNNSDARAQMFLTPLFRKYGITAAVFGHAHVYQRSEHEKINYMQIGIVGKIPYPMDQGKIDKVDYSVHKALVGEKSRGYAVVYVPPNLKAMNKEEKKYFEDWLNNIKEVLLTQNIDEFINVESLKTNLTNDGLNADLNLKQEFIDTYIIKNMRKCVLWRYYNTDGELLDHVFIPSQSDEDYDENGHKEYEMECPETLVR